MRYFFVDKPINNISLCCSKMKTPKGQPTLRKNICQVFRCSVELVAGFAKYFCCHIGEAFGGRKCESQAVDEWGKTELWWILVDRCIYLLRARCIWYAMLTKEVTEEQLAGFDTTVDLVGSSFKSVVHISMWDSCNRVCL